MTTQTIEMTGTFEVTSQDSMDGLTRVISISDGAGNPLVKLTSRRTVGGDAETGWEVHSVVIHVENLSTGLTDDDAAHIDLVQGGLVIDKKAGGGWDWWYESSSDAPPHYGHAATLVTAISQIQGLLK